MLLPAALRTSGRSSASESYLLRASPRRHHERRSRAARRESDCRTGVRGLSDVHAPCAGGSRARGGRARDDARRPARHRDVALYTTQRSELTRLRDTDGDGKADRYETVASWPLSGNYHEYSFGPVFSPKGEMFVTLNLAWIGYGESFVKWRGWMLKVGNDGTITPWATGFRSPSSFGFNLDGDLFYSENQGDWVGSGGISQVEKGDFEGNPKGLKWSGEPGSPVTLKLEDIPDNGEPKFEAAKKIPHLRTPAVWFPHTILGISTSAILVDSTHGTFGPF